MVECCNLVHQLIDMYISMMIIGVDGSGTSFAQWLGVYHGWVRDFCIDVSMGKMVGVFSISLKLYLCNFMKYFHFKTRTHDG